MLTVVSVGNNEVGRAGAVPVRQSREAPRRSVKVLALTRRRQAGECGRRMGELVGEKWRPRTVRQPPYSASWPHLHVRSVDVSYRHVNAGFADRRVAVVGAKRGVALRGGVRGGAELAM